MHYASKHVHCGVACCLSSFISFTFSLLLVSEYVQRMFNLVSARLVITALMFWSLKQIRVEESLGTGKKHCIVRFLAACSSK